MAPNSATLAAVSAASSHNTAPSIAISWVRGK